MDINDKIFDDISSHDSTTSTAFYETNNIDRSNIKKNPLEKGAIEEKQHTEKKTQKHDFINLPLKTESKYWDEYDDLPANAEDRKLWFEQEYDNLLQNITGQNCLIEEFKKTLQKELKTKRNKKLIAQLQSLLRSESEKNDGLITKALRIQRKYPDNKWEQIPYPISINKIKLKIDNNDIGDGHQQQQQLLRCQEGSSDGRTTRNNINCNNNNNNNNQNKELIMSEPIGTQCDCIGEDLSDMTSEHHSETLDIGKINSSNDNVINNNNNNQSNNSNNNNNYDGDDLIKYGKELLSREKLIDCLEEKYLFLNKDYTYRRKQQQNQITTNNNSTITSTSNNNSNNNELNKKLDCLPSQLPSASTLSTTEPLIGSEFDLKSGKSSLNSKMTNCGGDNSSCSGLILKRTDKLKVSLTSIKKNYCSNNNHNNNNGGQTTTTTTNKLISNSNIKKDQSTELLHMLKKKESDLQKILDLMKKQLSDTKNPNLQQQQHQQQQPQHKHIQQQQHLLLNEIKNNSLEISGDQSSSFKALHKKISYLQMQQKEFRKLIKEQQEQMELYQKKYIKAQQRVLGQKRALENIEMNNKLIENDIKSVIAKLKDNYDDKIKDFSKYPRLLKIEKAKCIAIHKDKRDLESKYTELLKDHRDLKEKLKVKIKKTSVGTVEKIKSVQRELKVFKNFNTSLKEERDRLKEEVRKSKDELEHFRTETNKLMFRSKDRTEAQRRSYQKKINDLERDLLHCRESATCFIRQRDKVISEMQMQLGTLSDHFKLSQKHIDTLRKQIVTLAKGSSSQNDTE